MARKIAQKQGTQRQPHPSYSEIKHPKCATPGCSNPKAVMDWHWTNGSPKYRPVCNDCHDADTAQRYAERTGATWVKTVKDVVAHKAGFTSLTEYQNSIHPYRKYRKDHCENRDGRLGYTCTATIVWDGQLDVDHIDGDPSNDNPANLQTLCKCCHAYKTNKYKDYLTPGRTFFGISY